MLPHSNSPLTLCLIVCPSTLCQGSWMQKELGGHLTLDPQQAIQTKSSSEVKGTPVEGTRAPGEVGTSPNRLRVMQEGRWGEEGEKEGPPHPTCLCSHSHALSTLSFAPSLLCSRTTELLQGARFCVEEPALCRTVGVQAMA